MAMSMNMNANMNANMKADAASKEIEEAMKRVREARSLISAAIEPESKWMERGRKKRWHCGDVLRRKLSSLHNVSSPSSVFCSPSLF